MSLGLKTPYSVFSVVRMRMVSQPTTYSTLRIRKVERLGKVSSPVHTIACRMAVSGPASRQPVGHAGLFGGLENIIPVVVSPPVTSPAMGYLCEAGALCLVVCREQTRCAFGVESQQGAGLGADRLLRRDKVRQQAAAQQRSSRPNPSGTTRQRRAEYKDSGVRLMANPLRNIKRARQPATASRQAVSHCVPQ